MWNGKRAFVLSIVLGIARVPGLTQISQASDTNSTPIASSGVFAHSGLGNASQLASSASTGYCHLNATNVHLSTSAPNNVAADAIVTCDAGQTIRISSLIVTLHKTGLIDHFLTGPTSGGVATSASPLYYNSFKTPCSSYVLSVYWSTAIAYGTYGDGHSTSASVTSPQQPAMACGTPF
jgi:hypothetical protein